MGWYYVGMKKKNKIKRKNNVKKGKNDRKINNMFSRPVILGVLAFVMAVGGYGGYKVVKDYGKYGVDFDKRLHVVESVVDGDTIILENNIKVRLLGVNAPEIENCFGEESKKYLQQLILGRKVFLEKDQKATDQYGRLLRYVILRNDNPEVNDVFANNVLVQNGYAKSEYIKPNRRYLQLLQAGEREAEMSKLGMWGVCEFERSDKINLEQEQASSPEDKKCVIKGNISKKYTKDYFLPGCPNYKRVIIDVRKGERWFCNEAEARKAGWQISSACENIHQFGDESGGRFK